MVKLSKLDKSHVEIGVTVFILAEMPICQKYVKEGSANLIIWFVVIYDFFSPNDDDLK
jgi:hypothetical protein